MDRLVPLIKEQVQNLLLEGLYMQYPFLEGPRIRGIIQYHLFKGPFRTPY